MVSVRFICGTQGSHRELKDTILYSSCFDTNGGLFETLLGAEDAVIFDALNHASIIERIRLCKARRYFVSTVHCFSPASGAVAACRKRWPTSAAMGECALFPQCDAGSRVHSGRRRPCHYSGEARLAQTFASLLQQKGIYVTGFFYPLVPEGRARIRTQISVVHTQPQLEYAVPAFIRIGRQLGMIA